MLRRLKVENYALIDRLELELDDRLNIITGETGAGKSILLGALGLLLGNKNDNATLKDDKRNCLIEGVFDLGTRDLRIMFVISSATAICSFAIGCSFLWESGKSCC